MSLDANTDDGSDAGRRAIDRDPVDRGPRALPDGGREDDSGGVEHLPDPLEAVAEDLPEHAPFLDRLRTDFRPLDPVVLGVVPVVLLAVYRLPEEVRIEYAFASDDPTILTAFAANYVHLSLPHLTSNVIAYLLLATLGYLLALVNGRRRRFFGAFLTFLLLLPAPLSLLNFAVPWTGIAYGFSGINMAFLGALVMSFAEFVSTEFGQHFTPDDAPLLFFGLMTFVSAPYIGTTAGVIAAVASVLLTLVYLAVFLWSYRPSLTGLWSALARQGYVELGTVAALVIIVIGVLAFPQNPFTDAGVVNVYIHLLGFSIGFIGTYLVVLVSRDYYPDLDVAPGW